MIRILAILLLAIGWGTTFAQTTVTIGTGTATQKQPFGMWASYERSATLYLQTEIGSPGANGLLISSLAWYVGTSYPTSCPVKIYMKTTGSSNLSSTTWASITSGATLVYDSHVSFSTTGWRSIDIADFVYSSGNLLVLCETNYGGNGASLYPVFRYSYMTGKHQFWQEYDNPPLGNGTVNENRPNIQISYSSISSSVAPPSGFLASAVSSSQVNLGWKKNGQNDPVLIAMNTTGSFGLPAGQYLPGDTITGGGVVVYNGSGVSTSVTGLTGGTTWYFRAWSVHPPLPEYSIGTGSMATTDCDAVDALPYITGFETNEFPPSCWTLSGNPWIRYSGSSGYGTGTACTKADFFNTSSGDFEMVTPQLSLSAFASANLSFDHAYATYQTQVDRLEVWISTDQGSTWSLLQTWLGGTSGPLNTAGATTTPFIPNPQQWATKTVSLPLNCQMVKFKGVSGYGNNLYLDNITISGICPPPVSPTAGNFTTSGVELDWTPAGNAAEWSVLYGLAGFNPATEGTLLTDLTYHPFWLDGLEQGTQYEYYVRSECGGTPGAWTTPVVFTTLCPVFTVPFLETFDTYFPPAKGCVVSADANSDNQTWESASVAGGSPPNAITLSGHPLHGEDDWFFIPGLQLDTGITYAVSFLYKNLEAGSVRKMRLRIGEGADPSRMTGPVLWENNTIDDTVGHLIRTTFSVASAADTTYLGWQAFSDAATGILLTDDILIDVAMVRWVGMESSDPFSASNWSPAHVPGEAVDVVIPAGTPFSPVLQSGSLGCRRLVIETGAILEIDEWSQLNVTDDLVIQSGGSMLNQGILLLSGDLENHN